MTGNMPGMAASTKDTWSLGAPPNSADAPENSLALESTCAWTSSPMITSQSPVAPLIQSFLSATRFADSIINLQSGRDNLPGNVNQVRLPDRSGHLRQQFPQQFP